jgi:myo-inositol-1(or 4)-monophosphatase
VEERIKVTDTGELKDAMINTGFPYDVAARPEEIISPLAKVLPRVRAVRRAGAASLDLAYLAAGRADGFWEYGLKPWDVAAGMLLISEAGGMVTDINGELFVLEKSDSMVAASKPLHGPLLRLLSQS